jgi:cation diffusion facilitator family transporter
VRLVSKDFFRYIPPAEARAILISVVVGIVMLAVKVLAYVRTGSAAILSDALEQVVNIIAALFAAYSLSTAHRPADKEHPYGHGKIEFLSAGFEGGMIVLAALVMFAEGAKRIWETRMGMAGIQLVAYGIVLIAVAMGVHGLLGLYLVRLGRRTQSITLEADGWHLLTDAGTSAVALASLLIVHFTGWTYADPLGAIAIALYISTTGWKLLRRSAAGLMDEQDAKDTKLLRGILDAHAQGGREPRICSYHKLRHRHSGRYHWVDFHIMIPAWWDVRRGHEIASSIEYEIEQALKTGNATAHVEPCPDPRCGHCESAERPAEAAAHGR